MKPQLRKSGLLVRRIGEESVVYDLERHEAHCLNASAAAVLTRCDGQTDSREMVSQLRVALCADVDERWVRLALDGLEKACLLELVPSSDAAPKSADRREVLRRAGIGAVLLLPAVVSIVAPTPAEAATCILWDECTATNPGTPCHLGDGNCTGLQCTGEDACAPI